MPCIPPIYTPLGMKTNLLLRFYYLFDFGIWQSPNVHKKNSVSKAQMLKLVQFYLESIVCLYSFANLLCRGNITLKMLINVNINNNKHILSISYMSGTFLSFLLMYSLLTHLSPEITLGGRHYNYPHLPMKKLRPKPV